MIPLTTIIEEVVQSMRTELATDSPYFISGRKEYIQKRLSQKSTSPEWNNKKFPLICLIGDFEEDIKPGTYEVPVNILFVIKSNTEKSNPERYSTTFPTAYSLMELFNEHLGKHKSIDITYPEYKKTDSSYYTGSENVFTDFTDVVACRYDIPVIINSCDYVEPTSFTLTVSAGTGGTTIPAPAVFTMQKDELKAFYADASTGYRFVQWLWDGAQQLTNPIAITIKNTGTLIAQFIKQWLVTTSVNGNGTITPSSGLTDEGNITIEVTVTNPLVDEFEKIEITPDGEATQTVLTNPLVWALNKAVVIVGYVKAILQNFTVTITKTGNGTVVPDVGDHIYVENDEVTITATETDPDFYLDSIYDSATPVSNPYVFNITENKIIEARFLAWLKVMDVFSTAPILDGATWQWTDLTDNFNDVPISNVRVGNFDTATMVTTGIKLVGQQPFNATLHYTPSATGATKYLIASKATSSVQKGFLMLASSVNVISIFISNGTTGQNIITSFTLVVGTKYIIDVDWNGLIGGTVAVTVNGVTVNYTATHEWVGDSFNNLSVSFGSSGANGLIAYAKVTNYFEWVFNHGQGAVIYDISGLNRNGTMTGRTSATFWNTVQNVIPFANTLGATLYSNNSDSTVMPICFNTSQAIVGFTKIDWFPVGSGVLVNLEMLYYITGVDSVIPAGYYTGLQLYNLATSSQLRKSQTANNIARLEVFFLNDPITLLETNEGELITEEDNTNNLLIEE